MTISVLRRDPVPRVHPPGDSGDRGTTLPHRSGWDWARQFFCAGVLSYMCAMVGNGILNLLQSRGDLGRLVEWHVLERPGIFVVAAGVLWLPLVFMIAVTGRLFLSCGLLLVACVVSGFANYEKLRVRDEPVLPSDLVFAQHAGFLRDMVSATAIAAVAAVAVLVMVIAVLLGRIVTNLYPRITRRSFPGMWRRWVLARLVMAVVSALLIGYIAQFNQPGNIARQVFHESGARWAWWYQRVNYDRNGAVAGFLYNLPADPMVRPADYSAERMARVAARYERLAARLNESRPSTATSRLNVVMVLSESFADPTEIPGVSLERDPIPYTRRVMDSTTSGHLLTQHLGGGTANMEFEALTGQSISQFTPQHDTPYSMSVYKDTAYPSIVGHLKSLGHSTIGVHPFIPGMYRRAEAYEALGFDDFVTEDDFSEQTRIDKSQFIADSAAFDEALRQMRRTNGPDLVNLVTMQNHYPTDDSYDDPMEVSGVDKKAVDSLGHFARGLEHSDAALRAFLDSLRKSDEPTAVIFYGDHQPALWNNDDRISSHDAMFRAPFFLWSNVKQLPAKDVPLTSPIFFAPMLFNALDLPLPPFYALLLELQEHASAMKRGDYYGPSGDPLADPESDRQLKRLLHDYRLVQYDFAVGERYAVSRMFPQKP